MVLVGSRRMVQYEDGSADESVRIYDRGLDYEPPTSFGEYRLSSRSWDWRLSAWHRLVACFLHDRPRPSPRLTPVEPRLTSS